MRLDGKVALITGISQGIGQAIAIRLSLEGAQVVIHYRSHPEGAEDTLEKVKATGGSCHMSGCPDSGFSVQADLGVMDDIRHLIEDGISHFGRLDILINNAGLEHHASFWDVTEKTYDQIMNVNLKGAFFAAQSTVRHLIEIKRSGRIINISSVHEELPFPNFAAYCASKGGIKMLTRNLAIELAPTTLPSTMWLLGRSKPQLTRSC